MKQKSILLFLTLSTLLFNGCSSISIEQKTTVLESGNDYSANDLIEVSDENANINVLTSDISSFIGENDISFEVKSGDKVISKTFTYEFVDTTPPSITQKEDIVVDKYSNFNIYDFITVEDKVSEDVEVVLLNEVKTSIVGEQQITISATDTSGNTSNLDLMVTVKNLTEINNKILAEKGLLPVEGLNPFDIVYNNESYIPKTKERYSEINDEYVAIWESSGYYGDTGALLSYYLMADPLDSILAEFTIENTLYSSEEDFKEWAKKYLGFNSTISYNTSSPDEARNWIITTIDNMKPQQEYSKIFGDAKFNLYGTPDYIITLEISADTSMYD